MYFFVSSRYLDVSEVLSVLITLWLVVVASKGITKSVLQFMDLFEEFRAPSPVKQRRGRRTLQTATVDDDGVRTASELAQTTTDRTSKYFPLVKKPNSKFALAAIDAGFEPTESKLSDVSEIPVEYRTPFVPPQLTAQDWMDRFNDTMRHECYLGNIPELIQHCNTKYPNGMSTRQVRAWLLKQENAHYVPKYLEGTNWAIDHIVSDSIGGISHPYNFFLLPRVLNNAFSGWATLEKRRCVGMAAWGKALDLQRWYCLKSKALVNLSQFDPVTDHALVQRSR